MRRREWVCGAATGALLAAAKPRLEKGIVWAAFPEGTPFADCISQAANAGFRAIELRIHPNAELNLASSDEQASRLAEIARKHAVEISSLWALTPSSPSLVSADAAIRRAAMDLARKAIQLAPALGCKAVLAVPGVLGRGTRMEVTHDQAWERATAAYWELLPHAERAGVTLTPENVWSKFLVSPRDMRQFVDEFKSQHVRVHLDTGNIMQFGFPEDWILTLGARIIRVHLKDYKLGAGGVQGRFVPLMEGDVQWKEVMASLAKIGYRGYLTVETGPAPTEPEHLQKLSSAVDRILNLI